MSFKPIQFKYTPPQTVQELPFSVRTGTAPAASNPLDPETRAQASRAAALLGKIATLQSTNQYLQTLIGTVCAGMGASLNYAGDPELAEALKRLYHTDTPPSALSAAMYGHLVAAEYGMVRTDIVLANSGSTLQPSPYQRADLQRATQTFEEAMASTGEFDNQLPLLLRELQGQSLVFDALTEGLQGYPVLAGSSFAPPPAVPPPPAGNYVNSDAADSFAAFAALGASLGTPAPLIDMSPGLSASLDQRLDAYSALYGSTYNVVSSVTGALGRINTDLSLANGAITAAALSSIDSVLALMAAYKTIQAWFHKPNLKAMVHALTEMMMPRLIAELSPFVMLLDRLVQRLTEPVKRLLQQVDFGLGQLAGVEKNIAYMVSPDGLTGVIKNHIHGKPAPQMSNDNAVKDALAEADKGIKHLIGYAGWGVKEIDARFARLSKTLLQAMDRSQQASGDRLETLASLKQLTNVLAVVQNVILQTQGRQSSASQAISSIGLRLPTAAPPVQTALLSAGAELTDVGNTLTRLKF